MKIAHVTATFPPYWAGTGNVAYNQAKILHKIGHHVEVFTALPKNSAPLQFDFAVHYLPTLGRIGNAPFTPGLVRHLKGFDIIHLHYPYIFGAELTLLASRTFRIPMVTTYHNQLSETVAWKQLLFTMYNAVWEECIAKSSASIITVAIDHLKSIKPSWIGYPLIEIPNAVDVDVFYPIDKSRAREYLNIPKNAELALFVGALDKAHRFKNAQGLLHAVSEIRDRPNFKLLLVGDGDLRKHLETLANRLGILHKVEFAGQKSPEQLLWYYNAANFTVLPSTSVESFGIVLIESLACQTTVLATSLPGVRSVVKHGNDGILIPTDNSDMLKQELIRMIENPQFTRTLGQHGYHKVLTQYTWNIVGQKLETLYKEVLQMPVQT